MAQRADPPTTQPVPTAVLDGAAQPYSRDRIYVLTAVALAVLTAIEIFVHVQPDFPLWAWGGDGGVISFLLALMSMKFFLVVYIFMHLRYDKPLLGRVFYMGLGLAVAVYIAMLTMFHFW